MKICYITKDCKNELNLGGIATYIDNISNYLTQNGHEIHIICKAKTKTRTYQKNGITIHAIKPNLFWQSKNNIFSKIIPELIETTIFHFQIFNKFNYLNKKKKIDIVESEEGGGISLLLTFNNKNKIITRVHTSWTDLKILNKKRNRGYWLYKCLEYLQLIRSKRICANSKSMKKRVSKVFNIEENKIDYLYCGINDIGEQIINNPIKITGDYFLYYGSIERRKGIDMLIKVIPYILSKHSKYKFVFAGMINDLKEKKKIDSIIEKYPENVILLKKQNRSSILSIVKNAKGIILPSYWEAFGFTCLESLALGKIVIATKGSGFEEIIKDNNQNGILYAPYSFKELTRAIEKVINLSNDELNQISVNAIKRSKNFAIKKNGRKHEEYYEQIIS